MYKLWYKNGLLYAEAEIKYNSKSVRVSDVIIDTGAFHTIILSDYLEELEVEFKEEDELVKSSGYGGVQISSVRKRIDEIRIGDIFIQDCKIDFGIIDPFERVNGLIGLDFLLKARIIVDLVDLSIYEKKQVV